MDWKSREITHHYNLRSLRGPRLRSRTRDQRNQYDASRSNSHLDSSYHSSRNTTQQQHRRDRSQRERRRNRSQGDRGRDRSQQSRRMNSTRRAHKALSGISDPSSDKPDEDESDDIKCIICIDTVDDSDMKYVRCGHSFHRICCNNWLKVNNACPVCRTVVAPRRICVDNFNRERVIDRVIDDTPINDIIYFFTLSVMGDLD